MRVSFDEAIALSEFEGGRYSVSTPESWSASGRAPGGLVEAQLFVALRAALDDLSRIPLSFTAHLLRAPTKGHCEVHTEVLRVGRTLSNLSARMIQDGKTIAVALASFGMERPSPVFDELPMPVLDPPNPDRATDTYIPEFAYPYGDNVVIQHRVGHEAFSGLDGPMERAGWVGFAEPRVIDAPALLMMGDVGLMGWWTRLDREYTTATLDHTTHFRSDPAQTETDLVVMLSRTSLVARGYLDWDVVLWAPDGTLLCQSRQLLAVLG
ncbi:MAG: acyl-CoA thioesterase [Acidimicrobiales bacterium]